VSDVQTMKSRVIPPVLRTSWAQDLLDHHRKSQGPVRVGGPDEDGRPLRTGTRKVAVLVGEGTDEALDALVLALSALINVEAEGRRKKGELNQRVRRLADRLRRAEHELQGPVRKKHDELQRQSRQLATAAAVDPLSTALNRRAMEGRLREAAELSLEEDAPIAVIMCDIDHFKQVNDTHGHLVGDAVIARVGKTLQNDRRRGDAVGRWGGEEFLILLPGCPAEPAMNIAEAMCAALRALQFKGDDGPFRITMSLGGASGRIGDLDGDVMTLVAEADNRLYDAKHAGRDRVVGPPGARAASVAS
jgi:diguanylate cyclase (GGDEF)-like protein